MDLDRRATIAVRPARAFAARPRLFSALAGVFPARFVPWNGSGVAHDAAILIGSNAAQGLASDLPVATFLAMDEGEPTAGGEEVRLLNETAVDATVRGVVLIDRLAGAGAEPGAGLESVLALAPSGPAWTRSSGHGPSHVVRSVLPELGPEQSLYSLLGQRPVAMIALTHFLRDLCEAHGWSRPPLRAAIVFDDPNLRWRSYGFIDYGRLLRHADEHGYHAAMAMVPLDGGRFHGPTAALFARRPDRLSVVFHGNDHTRRELLRQRSPASALALAAQAVRRIERFERRSGVTVEPVMMPPHGMCSEVVARALGAVGFDALCAANPIPWASRPPASMPLAGWRPAQYVGGCAVIGRFPFRDSVADIALRAFLDHPLVMYGHHDDLTGGLDPLAEAAARVNRLGNVRWTSVGEIARSNYSLSVRNGRIAVRPYAKRIRLVPPIGAEVLCVQQPTDAYGPEELCGWSTGSGAIHPFGTDVPVTAGAAIDVRLHGIHDRNPSRVPAPRRRPWPTMRRAASELSDRTLPLRAGRPR